jgi:hypothetical protein
MALHDEITALSDGAHFLRGDLHIHSFGRDGSYDVKDTGMTPQAIVDLAINGGRMETLSAATARRST